MATTISITELQAWLSAKPTTVRAGSEQDSVRFARIADAESGNVVNVSDGELVTRGDHKGEQMSASAVRATYQRKFAERMKESGLDVHVISWDTDGNVLPESEHVALLGPA